MIAVIRDFRDKSDICIVPCMYHTSCIVVVAKLRTYHDFDFRIEEIRLTL